MTGFELQKQIPGPAAAQLEIGRIAAPLTVPPRFGERGEIPGLRTSGPPGIRRFPGLSPGCCRIATQMDYSGARVVFEVAIRHGMFYSIRDRDAGPYPGLAAQ